mgnify:CR=1 FL=1
MDTNPYTSMHYKVDWLQLTENDEFGDHLSLSESKVWKFLTRLGYQEEDFEECAPRYFYNSGITLGRYLSIFYDDPTKEINLYSPKNVLFQFTGQGSTDLALKLAKYYGSNDFEKVWRNFFDYFDIYRVKVTRLDIALDDFNAVLNFDQMERKLKRKEFRSSKRVYQIIKSHETDGEVKGETIYFGKRKKHQDGFLVRFYDKYAEYKSKGDILPTQVENVVTGEGTHKWQRYEMELHGAACKNFIDRVLAGSSFGVLYKGLMRNCVEFLRASRTIKNKSYWQVTEWWEKFLEGAEKCSVTEPERDLDLGRLLRWLRISVVPSLHLLEDIGKEKNFDIYDLIKSCYIKPYAKKQERLKREVLSMPDKVVKSYIDAFKEGNY